MKIFTKKEIIPISLIILAFAVGMYLYPSLPDKVPSHWNAQGEINNWSNKEFAVLFFPSLTLVIYLLMLFVPLIDPLKKNYSSFAKPYFFFRTLFVLFFVAIYLFTLKAAFNADISIIYFILPAFSAFFILMGLFLPKVKKNYFVGIKTPWTLHSEEVWAKTHIFSGKAFIAAGLISLFSLLIPKYSVGIFIFAITLVALMPIVYSYLIFRKIKESNN